MLAHQGLVKNLVYFIVGTPIVADHIVSDCLHKLILQVIMRPLILKVWIGVGADSLCIVQFHVDLVSSQHVED